MQFLRAELHEKVYKVRRKSTVTTKLDAPYTLLSIRGQASRIPVSSEVQGEGLHDLHLNSFMPQAPSTATGTIQSTTSLVQNLPKENEQRLPGRNGTDTRDIRWSLAEDRGKLDRNDQIANKIQASQVQSETYQGNNRRVVEMANPMTGKRHIMPENVARKIAEVQERQQAEKKAAKRAATERLVNDTVEEARQERSSEWTAITMHQNNRSRGKIDDGNEVTVRFTSPQPLGKVFSQPEAQEAQDAPPITIKRHFSVDPDHQTDTVPLDLRPLVEIEPIAETKSFPDIKYGNQQPHTVSRDSLPISREESEGKDPGTAYRGKDGNIFMIRKHRTMNPFERLQAIQHVGEITSRDQAMGLHGQYHLALWDKQPEDGRKS